MATADVLTEMAQMFSDAKSNVREKAGLTPVAGEAGGPLAGKQPVAFPFDDPQTVKNAILQGLKLIAEMRVELGHVEEGLQTLAPLYGLVGETPSGVVVAPHVSVTAGKNIDGVGRPTEVVRQTPFDLDFAAKAAAAQAATFRDAPAPGPTGWTCPDHPDSAPIGQTSRRGRKYAQCSVKGCAQFER